MVLYRYLSSHWFESLRDGRLKLSVPSEFNDPYDCLGVCVGQYQISTLVAHFMNPNAEVYKNTLDTAKAFGISLEDSARYLATMNVRTISSEVAVKIMSRRQIKGIMFLLCFSSCSEGDSGHSLMWSHYANKCKGVRLGFDFGGPEFEYYLNAVKYSCERAVLNLSLIRDFENDHEYLRFNEDNLLTKSIAWAYEQEYRMMINDKHSEVDNTVDGSELRYWRFKPEYLQTVDLGLGIKDDEKGKILSVVKQKYPNAKVRQLKMSPQRYSFVLETIN